MMQLCHDPVGGDLRSRSYHRGAVSAGVDSLPCARSIRVASRFSSRLGPLTIALEDLVARQAAPAGPGFLHGFR